MGKVKNFSEYIKESITQNKFSGKTVNLYSDESNTKFVKKDIISSRKIDLNYKLNSVAIYLGKKMDEGEAYNFDGSGKFIRYTGKSDGSFNTYYSNNLRDALRNEYFKKVDYTWKLKVPSSDIAQVNNDSAENNVA